MNSDQLLFNTIRTRATLQFRKKNEEIDVKTTPVHISTKELERIYPFPEYKWKEKIKNLIRVNAIKQTKVLTPGNGYKKFYYAYSLTEKFWELAQFDDKLVEKQELDELSLKMAKYLTRADVQIDSFKDKLTPDYINYYKTFKSSLEPSLWLFRDDFGGRIHTPFTTMNRDVRKHILIDNMKTISIDIPMSQPRILASILDEHVGDNLLTEMILNGEDIYSEIDENRDRGKKQFFEMLFGRNQDIVNIVGADAAKWINELKKRSFEGNPSDKGNYTNLVWILQNTETKMMQKVWQELNVPFITIHDEVIVKVSDYQELKHLFDKYIFKPLNIIL